MATWNVGSMSGRSGEVIDVMKRRNVDICCIQESRWRGCSARWMGGNDSKFKFFWQGRPDGVGGVGIIVSEKWVNQIVKVNRHSDRIMSIKFYVGRHFLNIISAYAPQSGRTMADKTAFWDSMHDVLSDIARNEMVLLGGDLNGHVGCSSDGYEEVHGGMGYGQRNPEGEAILAFAEATQLVVGNTFFKKKDDHLITYSSGNSRSQIDYILVKRSDKNIIRDIKVVVSEECVPQHRLVCADVRVNSPRKLRRKFVPKLRVWRLKSSELQNEFTETIRSRLSSQVRNESVDAKWTTMRNVLIESAESICGRTKGAPRHKTTWWWNDTVEKSITAKRLAYLKWKQTGDQVDKEAYVQRKKEARRKVWEAQETKRCEFAEELHGMSGRNHAFKLAKKMAKESGDHVVPVCMRTERGTVVSDRQGITEVWKEYMERTLNIRHAWDSLPTYDPVQGPGCYLSKEEYRKAMSDSKRGKAGGGSEVVVEMLLAAGEVGVDWLTDLGNSIIAEGAIPVDWSRSIVVPLFKGKGDPMSCNSYRAIKLLEQAMKIHERVIEKRIRAQVELSPLQFGFMSDSSTTDAIFILRQVQEKYLAKNKTLYMAFLDLEKAFDSVPREVVEWALRKACVDEWLVKAAMILFENSSTGVRTEAGPTEQFSVQVGVHQGSVLSPLLFIIVMDAIAREVACDLPWNLLYADDLAVLAESKSELVRRVTQWKKALAAKGLKINAAKSKVMVCTNDGGEPIASGQYPCGVCRQGVGSNSLCCTICKSWVHRKCSDIKGRLSQASSSFACKRCKGEISKPTKIGENDELCIDGEMFEVVDRFCYLGDVINSAGGAEAAVVARVRCAWGMFRELMPFLTSRVPSLKTKGKVYDACVRGRLLYGSETWPVKRHDIDRLESADMRMIRWMAGASLRDRRKNEDLRRAMGLRSVDCAIRQHRLRWYGHVVRKDEEDCVKKVTEMKVVGNKKIGRPKKTWSQVLMEDLKAAQLRPQDAANRDLWRAAIRKVGQPSNPARRDKQTQNG